ncbi:FAD-dependent oxidoreductase [soil metagenome]
MLDYIIVGAGLSGICVTETLREREKSFVVFENGSQNSSTVAGGIYNPVILKRFTLAWNADEQLEPAILFYRDLEEKLGIPIIEELPIYRKFNSIEEQNNWFEALDKPLLAPFLDPSLVKDINKNIPSQFSFGKVNHTGRVNTSLLISAYREFLDLGDNLRNSAFEYAKLELKDDHIIYENLKARKIIFSEGYGMSTNPFFSFLPLHGNKGEYLIIKSEDLKLDVAVKSSVFILPLGNDLYKVGATYDNRDTGKDPTEAARETLISQVSRMITCDFEVVDQVAGIRPSTRDRKPLVGQHPEYQQLYCCNGFGSRGVLMAPTIARALLRFIENGQKLDPEIDLNRFII